MMIRPTDPEIKDFGADVLRVWFILELEIKIKIYTDAYSRNICSPAP